MAEGSEETNLRNEILFLSQLINNHKKTTGPQDVSIVQRNKYSLTIKHPTQAKPNPHVVHHPNLFVAPHENKRLVNKSNVNCAITKQTGIVRTVQNSPSKTNTSDISTKLLVKCPNVAEVVDNSRLISVNAGDLSVKIENDLKEFKKLTSQSNLLPSKTVQKAHTEERVVCMPNVKTKDNVCVKKNKYKWSANTTVSPKSRQILFGAKAKKPSTMNRVVIPQSSYKKPIVKPARYLRQEKNVKTKYKLIRKQSSPADSRQEKNVKTKYKFIRKQSSPADSLKNVKSKYKIVNHEPSKSLPFSFMRKVGKYSIKYVKVSKSRVHPMPSNGHQRRKYFKYESKQHRPRPIEKQFMKHHVIRRISKRFKTVVPTYSKLVIIGDIAYKSSRMRLSRTNKLKISKLNVKKSNVISVRGVKFYMDSSGKTLKRIDDASSTSTGPFTNTKYKFVRVDLGGKTYVQKEPGVLTQSQSPQARVIASRAINRSINHLIAKKRKSTQYCMFFNRFGKCNKKENGKCPYIHDPEKVAVCTRFLQGNCTVENCLFSHKICKSKMPTCSFFLRGRCNNDDCPYPHVNVNPNADICQDFLKGYCPLGNDCKKHHRYCCPEFYLKGTCKKGDKCPLRHVKKKKTTPKEDTKDLKIQKDLKDTKNSKEKVDTAKIPAEKKTETNSSPKKRYFEAQEDKSDLPPTKHKRLPSFIKLSDDEESESTQESPGNVKQKVR